MAYGTVPTKKKPRFRKTVWIPFGFSCALALMILLLWVWRPQSTAETIESRTTVVLEKLQALNRLEVMQAQLVSYKTYERYSWMGLNQDEFIMLVRGEAVYGLEFSKVRFEKDEAGIKVILPPVKVLHVNMHPESIEYVGLSKGWFTSQQRFENMKRQALITLHQDLKKQARAQGFKLQAEANARQIVEQLLNSLEIHDYRFEAAMPNKG